MELAQDLQFTLSDDVAAIIGESCRVFRFVPASSLTTFGVGGLINTVVEPKSVDALGQLLRQLKSRGLSWRILGFGSNVVVSDEGISSVVIRLGKEFADLKIDEDRVLAGAGCSLMSLSRKACDLGLSGLEFAAGIPASVGGALRMNAGAHGSEVADVVSSVTFVTDQGEVLTQRRDEIEFSYRSSSIAKDAIIVGSEFKLIGGDKEAVIAKRNSCLSYRRESQPLQMPSAGSAFRNPGSGRELSAGYLLEQCGLKGFSKGGVSFSSKHANWLVKTSEFAVASDIKSLIEIGRERVAQKFSIDLKPEIVFW